MRSIGALLFLVASSFAYDAVIFSSTTKITKDDPSLTSLISSASSESPLVFFVNPDFVLGQFSKAAAAYSTKNSDSSIVNAAKAAIYAESRFVPSAVYVPSPSLVSISSPLEKGHSIYLVSADNWSSLDKLSSEVLAILGEKAKVVVTNTDVVSTNPIRVKRVAPEDGVGAVDNAFPIVIPNVNKEAEKKPCLFYLEGLNFNYKQNDKWLSAILRDDGTGTKKFGYSVPICPEVTKDANQDAVFQFTIAPGTQPTDKEQWQTLSSIGMKLTMRSDTSGWWYLVDAELTEPFEIQFSSQQGSAKMSVPAGTKADKKSIDFIGLSSVFGYSWNCWDSQALFFGEGNDKIGVGLHGVQIAVYGKDSGKDKAETMSFFGSKVDSCTGTFSAGSWMGIVTSLVLIAVFIFGFLMLNSVQTGDRYDDPKQKQILINVRE